MFLALPFFFLDSCFDYQERIVFAGDFSGYVDFDYEVPVHGDTGESVISSLPILEERIRARYTGAFPGKTLSMENYVLTPVEAPEGSPFAGFARVQYRINFTDPEDLEDILMGDIQVYKNAGRIVIQRRLPNARAMPQKPGAVVRKFNDLALGSMDGKKLKFSVAFPWYYDLFTNYGSIVRPGFHFFSVPLESTMRTGAGLLWSMTIRANPRPREGNTSL